MWETIRLFFTDFKNTPLKDRIFALMSLLWFLTIAVALVIILYQNSQTNIIRKERDVYVSKVETLREISLKENKDYSKAILEAKVEAAAECQIKVDAMKEIQVKALEEKAADLQRKYDELARYAERINSKATKIENTIKP